MTANKSTANIITNSPTPSFIDYLTDLHSSTNSCSSCSLLVPTKSSSASTASADAVLSQLRSWKWLSHSVLIQPYRRRYCNDDSSDDIVDTKADDWYASCLPCADDWSFLQSRYSLPLKREELARFHLSHDSLVVPLNDEGTVFVLSVMFGAADAGGVDGTSSIDRMTNVEKVQTLQHWMSSRHVVPIHNLDGNQVHSLSREVDVFPSSISPVVSAQFTFADIFGGIGGFRLALTSLGGQCLGCCEIDPYARYTYRRNFCTENEFYVTDVARLSIPRGGVDVLCGGFPCQSFSTLADWCGGSQHDISRDDSNGHDNHAKAQHDNNKRGGLNTPQKGQLFFHLLRILRQSQPKLFLFENVKGLMNLDGGEHFNTILSLLRESGYNVTHGVVDTSWFLPQRRERVFFVGVRNDLLALEEDAETHAAFDPEEIKRRYRIYNNDISGDDDEFDTMMHKDGPPPFLHRTNYSSKLQPSRLGDILEDEQTVLTNSPHAFLSPHQWNKISSQSYTQIHSDGSGQLITEDEACAQTLVSSYRQSYLLHSQFVVPRNSLYLQRQQGQLLTATRKRRGIPSTKCNNATTPECNGAFNNQTLPRFFTPRECCRLQGFPETFLLPFHTQQLTLSADSSQNSIGAGRKQQQQQQQQQQHVSKFYRQIGNSVSPPCVIAVATDAVNRFLLDGKSRRCRGKDGARSNPVFDAVLKASPYPEKVRALVDNM